MNVATVKARVDKLRELGAPPGESGRLYGGEEFHIEEDAIHLAVLRAIARGADDPQGLAREAAKTANIAGSRWYA